MNQDELLQRYLEALENGTPLLKANPGSLVVLQTDPPLLSAERLSILRKEIKLL